MPAIKTGFKWLVKDVKFKKMVSTRELKKISAKKIPKLFVFRDLRFAVARTGVEPVTSGL